jgi:lysozyme family protein
MASFETSFNKVVAAEGKYSINPNDSGNYRPGTGDFTARRNLIGSKYGITPGTYKDAFGHFPTATQMRNITISQASAAYRKLFWNQIKGDLINDQGIADIIFDHAVNTNPLKAIRLATATLTALKSPANGNRMTPEILQELNTIPANLFFDTFKAARLAYYRVHSKAFLTNLTERVNKFQYNV